MNNHVEMSAIRAVLQDYMDGTYEADGDKLRGVFHEKAVMNGFLGSDTVLADPSVFIQDMTSAPSMKSNGDAYDAQVESIVIEGGIATAVVSETGFRGAASLVDCFHLIKTEEGWKISSKLFTTV